MNNFVESETVYALHWLQITKIQAQDHMSPNWELRFRKYWLYY